MGARKYDATANERYLETLYNMRTAAGVRRFLQDLPRLYEEAKIDGNFDVVVFMADLERAGRIAGITQRENEVIHLYLIQGYTQEETAELLGITQERVAQLTIAATRKLARVYKQWAKMGEGY